MIDTTNGQQKTSPFHWRRSGTGTIDEQAGEAYIGILQLVNNIYAMRADMMRRTFDPRRDIDEECGYPKPGEMTAHKYKELYDWDPYANRAVQLWPKEAFQVQPEVYESEDPKQITFFEKIWDRIGKRLRGGYSYFKQEKGSPIWELAKRAAIQARICQFGIIVVGLNDKDKDGLPAKMHMPAKMRDENWGDEVEPVESEPVESPTQEIEEEYKEETDPYEDDYIDPDLRQVREPEEGDEFDEEVYPDSAEEELEEEGEEEDQGLLGYEDGSQQQEYPNEEEGIVDEPETEELRELLYLKVFPQALVQVTQVETNKWHPRYGQPIMYNVTIEDPNALLNDGSAAPVGETIRVHWTRVIHIVDNVESNEWKGTPALQTILHPILDIKKVRGSSAEMYYKGAFPGLSVESVPQLGAEVKINEQQTKDMMELYQNSLQRVLLLMGMQAKQLSPTVVDPTTQINIQVESLCVALNCPVPVFKGYEIGEQASENNKLDWYNRVKAYQHDQLTPRVICPLVDRLIALSVLPVPKEGYSINWPELLTQSKSGKVAIGLQIVQALAAYVNGGVEGVMSLLDLYTIGMGFSEEEAYSIMKNLGKAMQDAQQKPQGADLPDMMGEEEVTPTVPIQSPAPALGGIGPKPTDGAITDDNLSASADGESETPIPGDLYEADIPLEQIQTTSMNGTQISSMLEIIDKLALKQYPANATSSILRAAFPALDQTMLQSIVNDIASYDAPTPPPAPGAEGGFGAPAEGAPVNVQNREAQYQTIIKRWDAFIDETTRKLEAITGKSITINQPAHNINLHIPGQEAPTVTNVVNVPESPTPNINVDVEAPTVNVAAPNVTVSSPEIQKVEIVNPVEIVEGGEPTTKTVEIERTEGGYKGTVTEDK